MKDYSIFANVIELRGKRGTFQFHRDGKYFYQVYLLRGKSFFYVGLVERSRYETNKALYEQALALPDWRKEMGVEE